MKLIALFALIFSLAGCGGSNNQATTSTPAAPTPSVANFKASAASITAGDSVTLTWAASNATTVTIDNGVGTVTGASVSVKPTKTTTYTLTAANSAGTKVTAAVTITVLAPPAITSFTASKTLLTPATTGPAGTTLSWVVSAGSTVSIDNSVGAQTGTSVSVTPSATTTYTLTAANSIGGTVTATVTVGVRNNLTVLDGTAYAGTDRANYLNSIGVCDYPNYLATDAQGNVYATDSNSGAVCKITKDGKVTVLVSNSDSYYNNGIRGVSGVGRASQAKQAASAEKKAKASSHLLPSFKSSGASGTPTSASPSAVVNAGLECPEGIAVTSDGGTIYVADRCYSVIRKIVVASDGTATISTLLDPSADQAGSLRNLGGLALDGLGNLYAAENRYILKIAIATDGTAKASPLAGDGNYGYADGPGIAAEFGYPLGIAVSADGLSVYVADAYDNQETIRRIATASDGTVTVSTVAGGGSGFQDGSGAASQFGNVEEMALSADGATLYVADGGNSVIRKIALAADGTATVSTIAGKVNGWDHLDGVGTAALFTYPQGVALDTFGNLYVSEESSGNNYSVTGDSTLREVALATNQVSTLVLNIFGNTGGSTDGIGSKAAFNLPDAVVVDGSGNIYVADSANSTIRKIAIGSDGKGTVTTLAGTAAVYGYTDGTGGAAQFNQPIGLAIDPTSSTLYVADSGNGVIRMVDVSTGAVTTISQTGQGDSLFLGYPWRLAVDSSSGLLYVADSFYENGLVTVDPATGDVEPLTIQTDSTGGLFNNQNVSGLAVYTSADKTKNYLYVSQECAVFKIDLSTMTVTTLAGSQICGYQDGPANAALFFAVWNLSVDSQGNVYAVDAENSLVRRITPDGNVTTVVGTYPSTATTMGVLPSSVYLPLGIAVDPTDNLLITTPNAVLTLNQ
jgi:sugar lactone lactonase YvrE